MSTKIPVWVQSRNVLEHSSFKVFVDDDADVDDLKVAIRTDGKTKHGFEIVVAFIEIHGEDSGAKLQTLPIRENSSTKPLLFSEILTTFTPAPNAGN